MTKTITCENRGKDFNDERTVEMPSPSTIGGSSDAEPVRNANEFKPGSTIEASVGYSNNGAPTADEANKIKPRILQSFKGYNGWGYIFKMCTDPDTSFHYILDPKIEGVPKGVSGYYAIAIFRDQFGKLQMVFFPEDTLHKESVTGETGAELLDRATREWVTFPKKDDGFEPLKFDLPKPESYELSYSSILDIFFGNGVVKSLMPPIIAHPSVMWHSPGP